MNIEATARLRPFHLAFPVHDLETAEKFYGDVLGCTEGRRDRRWIDFNLYGHQIVTHLDEHRKMPATSNPVDGDAVPVPHFGVILTMADWQSLADRLTAAGIDFIIEPKIRFKGQIGEQATMFFCDPSGNALEFKAFASDHQIFANDEQAAPG